MSNLIVIAYPERHKAQEVLEKLQELQKEYLIDLEDAAYIEKNQSGKIRLHQMYNMTGAGAAGGAMWGFLFGLLLFIPVAGMAVGAATGALMGKASDFGIDDNFIKKLGQEMQTNSSAIFVLVRKANPDKVIPELSQYGGDIIQTSLSQDTENKLKDAWAKQSTS